MCKFLPPAARASDQIAVCPGRVCERNILSPTAWVHRMVRVAQLPSDILSKDIVVGTKGDAYESKEL